MKKMLKFLKDEEGAAGVEYGILIAAVAAVIITLALTIGSKVQNAFSKVNAALPS